MVRNLSKSILLLFFSVVICCGLYPLALWAIGQIAFPFQTNGSLIKGPDGAVVGSRLIAQPFTKDEYFQPRPSAASYDASASASSALAASNYALRDRVAHTLGPLVTYKNGPRAGRPVAPDIEKWFGADRFQGQPHIVAQWADLHNGSAQGWVKADPTHAAYVDEWAKTHQGIVAKWVRDNPGAPKPAAADLAVIFFEDFSAHNPGQFPAAITSKGPDGKDHTTLGPVKDGADIQSTFFDMWRQEHPDADLNDVPGDLVTSSASGLDPHITLQNAEYQLDRVASKWAADLKRDPAAVKKEIDRMIEAASEAPWYGLAGEKFVNVLDVNLELRKTYGAPK
ncbi:MAG: potassium-transporting ATPase subunit C [Syntrophorhabdales bacterium]